eukprot:TRINITY_DN27508_c0_g1_i1.p1 TRINITY_DN27508_c0_g1~~TRINITY_DN27508_c0_g1_i1.p1  ORF type:complete len:539 (+),score=66.45 TRINITY_DN27508_c0_g1_i1:29-1645(+)
MSYFSIATTAFSNYESTEYPRQSWEQSLGGMSPVTPIDNRESRSKAKGILAMLFAEFDNVTGPVVAHQWPTDFISSLDSAKEMGLYGTYLIPHEALSGHICTWTHGQRTFLTYPVTYEDPKYFRNQYRTNLIFVFDIGVEIKPYKKVIQRVSQALQTLEKDCEWISTQSRSTVLCNAKDPAQENETPPIVSESAPCDERHILSLFRQIYEGLNTSDRAVVVIDDGCILAFQYFPQVPDPPVVNAWDVPIVVSMPRASEMESCDLTLQMLVPIINNRSTVASYASTLDIPIDRCCLALRHLIYVGVVHLIDVFQYSNMYVLVPDVFAMFSSSVSQSEKPDNHSLSLKYVSKNPDEPVSMTALIKFYQGFSFDVASAQEGQMSGGHRSLNVYRQPESSATFKRVDAVLQSVEDQLSLRNSVSFPAAERSERKLQKWRSDWREEVQRRLYPRNAVAFGILQGFLRRVHEIPIYDSHKAARHPNEKSRLQETEECQPLYNILAAAKGRCVDDICVSLTLSTGRPWCRADVMAFRNCCNILLK